MTITAPVRPARLRLPALSGALAAFVLIGAQQALYGPAIPQLRHTYGISPATAAAALSVHFAGAILGVFALPVARRRGIADGHLLGGALALIAAGCLAFAVAPNWPLALAAAFVAGLGFGAIDGGVNQVFTEVYPGGHGRLNLLHGCFGLGAIGGPIAVGLAGSYVSPFAVLAALALVALPLLARVAGVSAPAPSGNAPRYGMVGAVGLAFVAFFVLNVGLETGAAGWETSHLMANGLSEHDAGLATSGFWLTFTAVRFAVVPLCHRYSARTIVITCVVLTVLAALTTTYRPIAPLGYGLLGVAIGPLFPTGLVWLAQLRPRLTATVVAASMVGGIAFPPGIGLAVGTFGPTAVPPALIALAVAGLAAVLVIAGRRGAPVPAEE
ncbi:MFS transporter [Rugosimonospora acidiphila]|uniref:MFS transporter n=1 Tax=Rugosimonospora acidiphila TaxID=556531 RepID=A0ABP9SS69_9ACTN